MNNKKTLLILILVLVLLIGGATVLYNNLSRELAPNQLATQGTAPSGSESQTAETTEPEKMMAPDFTVYDLEGNPVKLSDFIGKPVVLNFWASWCGPCKSEMPDFDEAYAQLGDNIHFLMVNMTDGSRETVEIASSFIAEQGYSFPVFYDTDSEAAYAYSVYSLPTTFFIDAEGQAIAQATGAIDMETLQRGISMIVTDAEE